MLTITNEDNMALMARYPDKYFDLAIVDPPYGLNKKITGGRFKRYGDAQADWDLNLPTEKYFNELNRVAENWIIWGANYFDFVWPCRSIIFWDKNMTVDNYSDGELAVTSFDKPAKIARVEYNGFLGADKNRIHPTQKPISLYKWLLEKYAKEGNKILDTHLGSGSIAIACHDYGYDLTACELDPDYYAAAMKRIKNHVSQQTINF